MAKQIDFAQYLSIDETAEELNLARRSVQTMLSSGILKSEKSPFGGQMVTRQSVDYYKQNRRQRGGQPKKSES